MIWNQLNEQAEIVGLAEKHALVGKIRQLFLPASPEVVTADEYLL
jgi:hypothetical protein